MTATRKVALITGASGGIGSAFSRRLAKDGYDLILVDKTRDKLEILSRDLRQQGTAAVEPLVVDLATSAGIEAVEKRIGETEDLEMLINCAGFGIPGNFTEAASSQHVAMITVHVIASVRFCSSAIPKMIARRRGAIINVASIAALLHFRGQATYSSTKAYLLAFSESLQLELAGTGVHVQALCPGFVDTGFFRPWDNIGWDHRALIPRLLWTSSDDTVNSSLRALGRGPAKHIPQFRIRLLVALLNSWFARPALFLMRLLKRSVTRRVVSEEKASL